MGQPLRPSIGAFQWGDSFGYYLWSPIVFPLFVSAFTGRVKSRPVSAFVGVKGEDIRWNRPPGPVTAPECSGPSVLRRTRRRRRLQSAGRPRHARQGQDLIQFLSATLSHTQSIRGSMLNPRTWFHRPVDVVDPMAFNVGRGSEGHGGRG
jgi:hypothetical protein